MAASPPPPRLCPSYLLDVLSLLPREDIDADLHRVSRYVDSTVNQCPGLPRRKFQRVELSKENNYLGRNALVDYVFALGNVRLHDFNNLSYACCQELKVSGGQ